MQWHTQVGNIITNMRVKIDFNLPEFIATKIIMWECHIYESAKGVY